MNISDHPFFVWPFVIGAVFILCYMPFCFLKWLKKTSPAERKRILSGIFTTKTFHALREVFRESLLHRRIFRFNPRLGYMHMSLAFGWFLLIVVGKLETLLFTHDGFNPPYLPIFLKYFYPGGIPVNFKGIFFLTLMDLLLLFVLSGLALAVAKRFRSRMLGMKHTTRHIRADRIALAFLWFIFPLRWLAESVTAGIYHAGGFFTRGSGELLAGFLPLEYLFEPSWWAYSLALGGFFVAMPYSRYMHIFSEAGLIFLKHWGLKQEKYDNGYGDFQINACSRCGICTNVCQLPADAGIQHPQGVYFLRDLRYHQPDRDAVENCLMCGRCSSACPVDIGIDHLRLMERVKRVDHLAMPVSWQVVAQEPEEKVDVLYFAGCMSHLTPGIMASTGAILSRAGIRYAVLDEKGGFCCGRPAMQAGFMTQAEAIIRQTTQGINQSGASLLLVTCPICYKVFKEEYRLTIPVEHHTQYFRKLVQKSPALFRKSPLRFSYHDPCDLGRGSGVYDQPREIIRRIGHLVPTAQTRENSLCCGGSLANLSIAPGERKAITDAAYAMLSANAPDYIVTSCPLCKKTFAAGKREIPVVDLAEALEKTMIPAGIPVREKVPALTEASS